MRSIRARLITILLVGLFIALLVSGFALQALSRRHTVGQLDAGLEAARALATLVSMEHGQFELEYHDELTSPATPYLFEIRDQSGQSLARSERLGDATLPLSPDLSMTPVFYDVTLPDSERGRAVTFTFAPRTEDEEEPPQTSEGHAETSLVATTLTVTLADSREPVEQALAAVFGALAAVGVALVVVIIVLVWLGIRTGLAPLGRLATVLGTVTGDNLSRHFDDRQAPRELVPIYAELNRMLERVEATIVRERRFADAAAHELRTPLAELRSTIEVALKWPDPEKISEALREAAAIGQEMEALVASLLAISRATAPINGQEAHAVAIAPIIRDGLARRQESMENRQLTARDRSHADAEFTVGDHVVEIIVRNLVDNAVEYTHEGGSIDVHTPRGEDGTWALVIENGPVDLSDDDLPKLTEPLWRRDIARTDRHHSGLGLTIVDRLARSASLAMRTSLVSTDGTGRQVQVKIEAAQHDSSSSVGHSGR